MIRRTPAVRALSLALVAILMVAPLTPAPSNPAPSNPAPPSPGPAVAVAKEARASDGKLFAILLRPGPAWNVGRPFAEQGLRPHFDYWIRLHKAGRLVSAGPLGDDSGLVILRAADQAEADSIAAADPAVTARIFKSNARIYAPPMINPDMLARSKQ